MAINVTLSLALFVALPCPTLAHPVLTHPVQSSPVLHYPTLPCSVLFLMLSTVAIWAYGNSLLDGQVKYLCLGRLLHKGVSILLHCLLCSISCPLLSSPFLYFPTLIKLTEGRYDNEGGVWWDRGLYMVDWRVGNDPATDGCQCAAEVPLADKDAVVDHWSWCCGLPRMLLWLIYLDFLSWWAV